MSNGYATDVRALQDRAFTDVKYRDVADTSGTDTSFLSGAQVLVQYGGEMRRVELKAISEWITANT